MTVIRRMRESDLEQVCTLEKEVFSLPWSYQSFLESMRNPDNIYLVAEEKGQLTGYCGVWVVAGEGQINNIAVKEQYRNQGIGAMMLRYLFTLGSVQNVEQFTLEVRSSNIRAIHLYEKMGFVKLGIRPNFYERPSEDAVIMSVITSRKEESALI